MRQLKLIKYLSERTLYIVLPLLFLIGISNLKVYSSNNTGNYYTVICSEKPEYSYVVYKPTNSNSDKLPALFFFEPAARSLLPIKNYKELAEKYNVLLICSIDSRNDYYEKNQEIADAILIDALKKFNIDRKCIIFSGFSGGSRFSYQYASLTNIVDGVIGCGAGLFYPYELDSSTTFFYSTIIGVDDFNFREIYDLKNEFLERSQSIQFITFNGGHTWPPAEYFERALVRMLLELKGAGKNYYKKELIKLEQLAFKAEYSRGNYISACWVLDNIIAIPGLSEYANSAFITYNRVLELEEYKLQEEKFKKDLELEDVLQNLFLHGLKGIHEESIQKENDHMPISWWKSYINNLNTYSNGKDIGIARVGTRAKAFSQNNLTQFFQQMMEKEAYAQALEISNILLLCDDKNMYYYINQAIANTALNKYSKAEKAFRKAVNLGFNDFKWVRQEPFLKILLERNSKLIPNTIVAIRISNQFS